MSLKNQREFFQCKCKTIPSVVQCTSKNLRSKNPKMGSLGDLPLSYAYKIISSCTLRLMVLCGSTMQFTTTTSSSTVTFSPVSCQKDVIIAHEDLAFGNP
jgi:hypothetical protein